MANEDGRDKSGEAVGRANKGPGAPKGNLNAWKHGRYSRRKDIVLTCRLCAAANRCIHRNMENPDAPCVYEKRLKEPEDLTSVDGLRAFLQQLIELDYARYRRGLILEILGGGLLDGDLTKLGQHLQKEIYTLGRLIEIGELEERVKRLEEAILNETT